MYLMNLFASYWMALAIAGAALWALTGFAIPTHGQRNDDATCKARAQRAKEYRRLRRMDVPK